MRDERSRRVHRAGRDASLRRALVVTGRRAIVFARVDTSAIPVTHRYEFTANAAGRGCRSAIRTPARQTRESISASSICRRARCAGSTIGDAPDDYLARVNVARGDVVVQSQSRDQRTLDGHRASVRRRHAARARDRAASRAWINLHNNFRFVGGGADFLWTSERGGVVAAVSRIEPTARRFS